MLAVDEARRSITMELLPCSMHDVIGAFVLPEHAVVYLLHEILTGVQYLHR